MKDKQHESLEIADELDELLLREELNCGFRTIDKASRVLRDLNKENEKLRSVMIAAAEEISAHWEAHCDSEGYGPVNLMRRLEQGIPSEYGYTVGAFANLRKYNAELQRDLELLKEKEKTK
jgi:hypothetical protein